MPSYKDEATGKWYCSFYYTDLRGKRVRKLKRGFKFKREADKWEREFLMTEHPEDVTVDVLIAEYEAYLQNQFVIGEIKESTLVVKKNRLRLYVKPYFKDVIANNVKAKDIKEWLKLITVVTPKPLKSINYYYRNRPEEKRKTRRSSQTLNEARAVLKQVFDWGVKYYGLKTNPVNEVARVKKYSPDERAKIWSVEQYQQFRNILTRKDMIAVFDIMFYAGLRIGEVMMLTPSDITPYQINIDKALVQLSYKNTKTDTPKSENSTRYVQIPKFLYESLKEYIDNSFGLKPTDVIFDIKEQTVRVHLNANATKAGLPRISPHCLRHSYASHLLKLTNDPATVAKQIGDTVETLLKTYAHMVPDADREAADIFEKYIEQKK